MPLISKQKKQTYQTIGIRLEDTLVARLKAYAEYLESSPAHIVSEALSYVMERDKEFTAIEGAPQKQTGQTAKAGK